MPLSPGRAAGVGCARVRLGWPVPRGASDKMADKQYATLWGPAGSRSTLGRCGPGWCRGAADRSATERTVVCMEHSRACRSENIERGRGRDRVRGRRESSDWRPTIMLGSLSRSIAARIARKLERERARERLSFLSRARALMGACKQIKRELRRRWALIYREVYCDVRRDAIEIWGRGWYT